MAKTPKSRQEINVILEQQAIDLSVDGEVTQQDVVEKWMERLYADASLLGLDFRAHAQNDVELMFKSRYPDWDQPMLDCFQERLWIPFNKKGGKVLLLLATDEHWTAYEQIMADNNESQNRAYKHFKQKAKWLREHWGPEHGNIGDVWRDNRP
jgi:hypothetical protein